MEAVEDVASDVDVADVDDENTSLLLYTNKFLSPAERDAVAGESRASEEDLLISLTDLNNEIAAADEVSVKTIGKVMRIINSRLTLKFFFSVCIVLRSLKPFLY